MGLYLNPGNQSFADVVQSDIYVDKTGLIGYMNGRIGKEKRLIASSRPRRFGKTMAVKMLTAYYSKGCNSRALFEELAIAKEESFSEHLNKYDVLRLDIQWMRGIAMDKVSNGKARSIIGYIQREVLEELRQEYPEFVAEDEISIASALAAINNATQNQFVIIIDEWDCFFREDKENTELQEEYIRLLRSLFKGSSADEFVKLAYITGILPIKKYGTQSALNNFRELTMINPGKIAEYIGFTEDEVSDLCKANGMSFDEMQKWYDGYIFSRTGHIYSPNSVMEAIDNEEFRNYWTETETYESLKIYIESDFEGLRQKIVDMLAGNRCQVNTNTFQNDMTTLKSVDDVLTLLIHLGYLAYDNETGEVFIPNEEVRGAFISSITDGGWESVYQAIRESESLMKATLEMDETAVAKMIHRVHTKNSPSLVYNNEISLASVIQVAYYTAARDYTIVRELPAGEGFADMVFIPKRASRKPALVIELKWNKSAKGAIQQIKDRQYVEALDAFKGNILLVGINYDKKEKVHECHIEKYEF